MRQQWPSSIGKVTDRNCVGGIDSSGTANVHIDIFTCLSDIGP
jgi:hypothetical protein